MRGWYRVAATAMVGGGLVVATGRAWAIDFTVTDDASLRSDSAVVGLRAADATHLYLSDDGEIAGGTDNHALNHGVRVTC